MKFGFANSNNPFNVSPKVRIAIEQIARMRVAGIRDNVIAARLGSSTSGLSRILALPEYQEFEEAILQGTTSQMDEALAGKVEDMKRYFEHAIPAALSTLFETVRQRRDLRAAMSAAGEILDRDPNATFAKRARVGQPGAEATAPTVSREFLDGVAKVADVVAKEALQN